MGERRREEAGKKKKKQVTASPSSVGALRVFFKFPCFLNNNTLLNAKAFSETLVTLLVCSLATSGFPTGHVRNLKDVHCMKYMQYISLFCFLMSCCVQRNSN